MSPWMVGLILIGVVAVLGWLVFFSPVFSARTIVVVGAEQVTDDEVLAAADVPTTSALARLPLDDIALRVERLDAVATARVEREWPDTVRIIVTERRPVAIVSTADGFGIVGSDGTVYRTEPRQPPDLPLLKRLSPAAASDTAATSGDASVAAFTVAASLPSSLRRKVELVDADSVQTVQLVMRSGAVVEWGNALGNQRKAEVLKVLLRRDAARYDVSVPDAPAWSG